jgi:hypothetical protein
LFLYTSYIMKTFSQNWGDYADMSQAVTIYVVNGCHVLLICWFGTQLAQHVRENGFCFYCCWLCLKNHVLNVDLATNRFLQYPGFHTESPVTKSGARLLIISKFPICYSSKIWTLFWNFSLIALLFLFKFEELQR